MLFFDLLINSQTRDDVFNKISANQPHFPKLADVLQQAEARIGSPNMHFNTTMAIDSNTSLPTYIAAFITALAQRCGPAQIISISRQFIDARRAQNRLNDIVFVTNYVFKSLSLDFSHTDVAFLSYVLQITSELHFCANRLLFETQAPNPSHNQLPQTLDSVLQANCANFEKKHYVVIFLTPNYIENLKIWLRLYLFHDNSAGHLLVFTINDENKIVQEALVSMGAYRAKCVSLGSLGHLDICGNGSHLNFLWYIKIHIVAYLVKQGYSVTYSDLDAYWLKNYTIFYNNIISSQSPDVMFSITRDMPRWAVTRWGFTPCAGFFSVRNTVGGLDFVSTWLHMTKIMFDDQIAIAELISRQTSAWDFSADQKLAGKCQIYGETHTPVTIVLLDDTVALRVGHPDPKTIGETTVWHPRWAISPAEHEKVLAIILNHSKKISDYGE